MALWLLATTPARAFCGFYVSGADAKLFNNATMVVMMRDGTRTVLSMQNNYQGPPDAFAMVVPVPVVLQEDNVKTLPREIFDRVDQLAAPRLVEYWEQDPCAMPVKMRSLAKGAGPPRPAAMAVDAAAAPEVVVEAEFTVGEYDIVILSATDSGALDTWLRDNKYNIPEGAEPVLEPYVQDGMKFFVAKVDPKKVTFKDGMATLSPLRFHYDTDRFSLPVRLGLLNAQGKQDLIVHILAKGKRYELANYENVTIPTNIDLSDAAKEQFGPFYVALFDQTLEKNPGSIVTEYAWDASSCDPCPTPALNMGELATLGADVLNDEEVDDDVPPPMGRFNRGSGFVLTRLHARYDAEMLKDDLVFKEAEPIVGGREVYGDKGLEKSSSKAGINNFQGRYAIRHEWDGPIECDDPVRGRWGGPPAGESNPTPRAARDLAFAPRGKITLASMVQSDVDELGLKAPEKAAPTPASSGSAAPVDSSKPAASQPSGGDACGSCRIGSERSTTPWTIIGALAIGGVLLRRRSKR